MQVDRAIGQVESALKETGSAEITLLIITSDNGSFMYRLDNAPEGTQREDHVAKSTTQAYDRSHHQSNHIWRGTKADIWDGGHRVPFIVR